LACPEKDHGVIGELFFGIKGDAALRLVGYLSLLMSSSAGSASYIIFSPIAWDKYILMPVADTRMSYKAFVDRPRRALVGILPTRVLG
jgi:hypothetical protein